MDDRELVTRCIRGESAAWDALVERHTGVMRALARRVLAEDETDDAVQGTFLKLWADGRRRLRAFRGDCRLSTWLGAVARRDALDRARKRERDRNHVRAARADALRRFRDASTRAEDPAGPRRLDEDERARRFEDALGRLPARDRLLVRFVHQDGCTYREAARLLAARENSIGPWLNRAHVRLRSLLEPQASRGCTDPSATDL